MNWRRIGIDTVGIFALSNFPDMELLKSGIERLKGEGLNVVLPGRKWGNFRRMAGTDIERASAFNAMLENKDIDMMIAARGGYGAGRVLEYLDWELLARRGIPVVGYSDVTALHLGALSKGCRLNVMGPMVCSQWSLMDESLIGAIEDSLFSVLGGKPDLPDWHGAFCMKPGQATGRLIPANLAVMVSLIGSEFFPNFQDAILVLEDVCEAAHSIDRMLNQLRLAGVLAKISGLVFGQFTRGEDAEFLPDIMADYAQYVKGPVASGLAFGHVNPSVSLPVGQEMTLTVSDRGVSLGPVL